MKEANDHTSLSNFWTFVPANGSFDIRQFLFCEVVISGFWHAQSLSRLLKYIQPIT